MRCLTMLFKNSRKLNLVVKTTVIWMYFSQFTVAYWGDTATHSAEKNIMALQEF